MQKRNPKTVFFLQVVTLGLYLLYWCAKSRKEVNAVLGRQAVPTIWWFIVPLGCFWWAWLYADALGEATGGQIKRDTTFGIWLVAALGLTSSSGFSYHFNYNDHNNNSLPSHINWTLVAVVAAIIYLIFAIFLGFFPAIMQSKINKLDIVPKNQIS